MEQRKDDLASRALTLLDRRWKWIVVATWLGYCAWFIYSRWAHIHGFALGDTDDNLRMSQVRALLAGQDWYDLRQYRLNPPAGADVHWTRLVDLPIAGLILLMRPLVGGIDAERVAIAVAPLVPYLLLMFGLALTIRRLVARPAYVIAFIALFFAGSTNGMFVPTRMDHHGWQLALLSLALAGMADPRRARGGATLGLATAASLSIGLELLIYLALAGAAQVLFWIDDRDERRRLQAYAVTLSGGTALGFTLFASYANRQAVCDALSPVWLSDALLGGALLFVMARFSPVDWKRRLLMAAAAGVAIALFHAGFWPQCISRLEGVSPEVEQLWLNHVREARPVYTHGWRVATFTVAIPITGLIGLVLLAWARRADRALLRRILAVAAPALAATVLLLWQTRTGPAAQTMGLIGASAFLWTLAPVVANARNLLVRTVGLAAVAVIGLGAAAPLIVDSLFPEKRTERDRTIGRANASCSSLSSLSPIARQPKGTVFSFVDYGPRLITVTHHNAVTGPYHRNGEQIADVMKAFRGSPEQARAILAKYRSDYLLICPSSSTSTIFRAKAPTGFYVELEKGRAPQWLDPIALPEGSPFKMWKVRR